MTWTPVELMNQIGLLAQWLSEEIYVIGLQCVYLLLPWPPVVILLALSPFFRLPNTTIWSFTFYVIAPYKALIPNVPNSGNCFEPSPTWLDMNLHWFSFSTHLIIDGHCNLVYCIQSVSGHAADESAHGFCEEPPPRSESGIQTWFRPLNSPWQ